MRIGERYVSQYVEGETAVLVDNQTGQEAELKLDRESVGQIIDHIRYHQSNGGPIPFVDQDGGALLVDAKDGTQLAFAVGYFFASVPPSERS